MNRLGIVGCGVMGAGIAESSAKGGCGMPMDPLRLRDMIGLDTMLLVAESLYAERPLDLSDPAP